MSVIFVCTKEGKKTITTNTTLDATENIPFEAIPSVLKRFSLKKLARQRGGLTNKQNSNISVLRGKKDFPNFAE